MINICLYTSFIKQTCEYGNIDILMGCLELILIVDVVLNIVNLVHLTYHH